MDITERDLEYFIEFGHLRGFHVTDGASLWGNEYVELSADAACDFIFHHVRSLEEVTQQALLIPDKPYMRDLASEWFECYNNGVPLHVVKSRRLIISWFIGAIEVYVAGVRPTSVVISARHFEGLAGAQHFVWRAKYLYDSCRARFNARKSASAGSRTSKELSLLVLPNGSTFSPTNSDPEQFRGGGASIVRLEELSSLPYAAPLMGQARAVTQGKPGTVSGFICSVSNPAYNEDYLDMIEKRLS